MTRFFKHESCGKCTPCREGTYWMLQLYQRITSGQGSPADVDTLFNVASQIVGKCFCPLGEFATSPVLSSIKLFKADYEVHVVKKAAAPAKTAPAKAAPKVKDPALVEAAVEAGAENT
jgi:NADH-quinone oxidoreductase subunit F